MPLVVWGEDVFEFGGTSTERSDATNLLGDNDLKKKKISELKGKDISKRFIFYEFPNNNDLKK